MLVNRLPEQTAFNVVIEPHFGFDPLNLKETSDLYIYCELMRATMSMSV